MRWEERFVLGEIRFSKDGTSLVPSWGELAHAVLYSEM